MALRRAGFWDEHYGNELKNYEEDGDEGEIWFGKQLSRRIVDWIIDKKMSTILDNKQLKILDVGCGNAFLLHTLVERFSSKFRGQSIETSAMNNLKLLGIDYSPKSIELSKKIVASRKLDDMIVLKQCDFLDSSQIEEKIQGDNFDVVIDVGTYDAICLLADDAYSIEETKLKYMRSLYELVHPGSVFILASCNYTQDELIPLFSIECHGRRECDLIDKIETPKLKFGGKEGSQVSCLIMKFL